MVKSLYLTGLGGQGVLTLAKIIGNAASEKGLHVTVFNAKGMAQRGGRVTSEIRISDGSEKAAGSRIAEGGADLLVGLEIGEALNSFAFMKEGGLVVLLDYAFHSAPTVLKKGEYPTLEQVQRALAAKADRIHTASSEVTPNNMCVLGVLSALADSAPDLMGGITSSDLELSLKSTLKRGTEVNIAAFKKGAELVTAG